VKALLPPTAAGVVPTVPLKSMNDGPSIFQVLNIFRCHWFLNRDHLIANILAAQKDESSRIHWVDFQPNFHTHLICWAITLLPPLCPLAKGKQCMFIFILEVLAAEEPGPEGSRPFFNLPKKTSKKRSRKAKTPPKALAPTKAAPPATPSSPPILAVVSQAILQSPPA
jgi:hypothetical protein